MKNLIKIAPISCIMLVYMLKVVLFVLIEVY